MKKVIVSEIADKSAFEEKLSVLFWVFDRFGIAHSVKEKSINDFITKTYKKYSADLNLFTSDLEKYGWILKEETLSKILGEANKKREEHEIGMAVKNNITNWMPKRTWSICINEVVLPKMHLAYFPHEGIAFLFHSIISRFRHWQDSQILKTDYEKFHPGISIEDLIPEKKYLKWQLKELDKSADRNKKRLEERLRNEERLRKIKTEYLKEQLALLPSPEEQERLKEQAEMDQLVLYELDYLAMYGRNPESFDSGFSYTKKSPLLKW